MDGYGGTINPNDVATLSLLGGGAFGFGGRGTREPFDGTVVNNNVERNAADIAMQNSFTREQIRELGIDQKLSDILFQNNDFRRETQQAINDARAETAKCCCEVQQLVVAENNATRTLLLEQRIAQQDNAANAAGQTAILNAIQALTVAMSQGGGRGNGGD